MASEILGLFTSPEMYQQQQDLMMQKQAAELAQLDPYQSIRFGAIRAGQQFGRGLAGLLGAEDPQLRMISARQSVLGGLDLGNPDSILDAARQLANAGDQQGALALADYARKAQADAALVAQRTREGRAAAVPKDILIAEERARLQTQIKALKAAPASPDRDAQLEQAELTLASLPVSGGGKAPDAVELAREFAILKGPPGSKAYQDEYTAQLTRLTAKETKPNIQEVGVAIGTNAPVYLDEIAGQQFIFVKDAEGKQVRQPYFGGVDRTTAKVSASAASVSEKAFSQRLGTLDANRVQSAVDTRDNSIAAINSLNRLTSLSDAGLISGPYAGGRAGVVNFLDALGLTSEKDKGLLARSENYQKIAGDIVLATLGGRLGAGFSNEDRKFIQGLVPQLETSAAGRRQLLDFLLKKNQEIIDETTRLEDYARENNSLKGFKSKIPIARQPSGSSAAGMSDDELKAARARLTGGNK
jgi:hypothetical protein